MRIKNIFLQLTLILSLSLTKCTNSDSANNNTNTNAQSTSTNLPFDSTVLKIYVNNNGEIKANENLMSLEELDNFISSVKPNIKAVHYSRYNAQEYQGPKESLKVIDIIIKHRLPLVFYTDSTFSQVAPMN